MKKAIGFLILLGMLYIPQISFAVGTWTDWVPEDVFKNGNVRIISATFVADGADATIPAKTLPIEIYNFIKGYLMCFVAHDPAAVGPTNAAWDITAVGATSGTTDITGGAAANLSSTVGQIYQTKDTGSNQTCIPVIESFNTVITGNAVNSGSATVKYIFYKP
jgi:hypothetical protein